MTEARIALSGVAPTPVRATAAERALVGQRPSADAWAAAAAAAASAVDPPSDVHGTSAYRRHLVGSLVRRALEEASMRTGGPS